MSSSFDISKNGDDSNQGVHPVLYTPKEQFVVSDNEYNASEDESKGARFIKNDRKDMQRMGKRQELIVSSVSIGLISRF